MTSGTVRHVFITGPPGIGKTTVIQKVSQELLKQGVSIQGFYTSEVREGGRRCGFDIISLDGSKSPLARIGNGKGPRVGQYSVLVEAFESIALPILRSPVTDGVMIIDEVGKMELLSPNFERAVMKLFSSKTTILGSLPVSKGKPLQLVEFLRAQPSVKLLEVNSSNRDSLVQEIVQLITLVSQMKGK